MITPTGITASDYWDAIKAGNPTHVRITFLGQNIVLTDEDIEISTGLVISDIFNDETDLVFGKAVCKQLTTSIVNSSRLDGLIWTSEFTLEMGVEINGTTNWVTVGYFSGEKPNNVTTVQTIEFTAYDRMILFDQLADNYVSTITYPATIQNIYDGLCAFVGVENVSGDELPNIMSRSYASAPVEMEGYTCRDILSWIAEACGCYATITEAGKVRMSWFESTSHAVTGDEEFDVESADVNSGMTWDEADTYTWDEIDNLTWNEIAGYQEEYAIDRIVVRQIETEIDVIYPSGLTEGNTYMIVDNPFMSVSGSSEINNYIVPIYITLTSFGGYLPFRINCIGNWCIEAGDIITVDIKTYTITVPVFSKTMAWNGFTNDEYEATGNKVRNAYTSDSNKQKILNAKEIRLMVEGKYYNIQSGIVIDEDGVKISGGKYVDILSGSSFKVESGGSVDVKSGGNLNVESGGNININGSGTLALTGSSVSIKSGSTFDVESTDFKIDSTNRYVKTGEWEIQRRGLLCEYYDSGDSTDVYLLFGRTGYLPPDSTKPIVSIQTQVVGKTNSRYNAGFDFSVRQPGGTDWAGLSLLVFPNSPSVSLNGFSYSGGSQQQMTNNFGNSNNRWNIYGAAVHYNSLVQDSSKDVKHDIQRMQPVGNKLDGLIPVTYVYDDDEEEKTRMGLIYEDTIEVMPEICTGDESEKAISYVELIPALLKEIQDLRIRVKTLEER